MQYDDPDYELNTSKSKSQVKREMHALQDLGERLLVLPKSVLEQLPLTEELILALEEYKRIGHRSAQKRQRQFIGKVMRDADSDSILQKLKDLDEANDRKSRQQHLAEKWRSELIEEGSVGLENFIKAFPTCDRQALRQLQRASVSDKESGKNTGAAKKLFHFIQEEMLRN